MINIMVMLHIINIMVWSPPTQETMEARTAVMEVIEVPDDQLTLCLHRGEIFFLVLFVLIFIRDIFVLLGVRYFCPRLACPYL